MLVPYTHIAVALVVASVASLGTYRYNEGRHAIKDAATLAVQTKKDKEHAQLHADQERDLHVLERKRSQLATDALNRARERAPTARVDAARARDADERVRSKADAAVLAARASHEACTHYADTLRTVFKACSAEYREVGELAGGHADDAQTLDEAWSK